MKTTAAVLLLCALAACRHAPPSEDALRARLQDMSCFGKAHAMHSSLPEPEGEEDAPARREERFKDYVHRLSDVHGFTEWAGCLREKRPKGWREELQRVDQWLLLSREEAARLESRLPEARRLSAAVQDVEVGSSSVTYRYALSYPDGRTDTLTETHAILEKAPSAKGSIGRIRLPCLSNALAAIQDVPAGLDRRSAEQREADELIAYSLAFKNVQGQREYLACLQENKEDGWEALAAGTRELLARLEKDLARHASMAAPGRTLIDVKTDRPSADPSLLIVRTQLFFADGTTKLFENRYPKKP